MNHLKEVIHNEIVSCPGRVSVYVEVDNWRFEHNSEDIYSSASLIKIPILIESLRQYERGLFSLDDVVSISKESTVGGSGVLQALDQSSWKVKDLLTLMIIVSDNTATNILIDLVGIDAINHCMELLQLKETKLRRMMMDFTAMEQGKDNKTCASEMAECLKVLTRGHFLSKESIQIAKEILQYQQFNHKIPAFVNPEVAYVGSKTGGLPGVEHDCAVISYKEKNAYIAILIDEIPEGTSGTPMMQSIGKAVFGALVK
jgi:beta-lactamase class A